MAGLGVPVFVDCEARGRSPVNGVLTEFGAVHYETRQTFHGRLFEGTPDPVNPAVPLVGPRVAEDAAVAVELRRVGWCRSAGAPRPSWSATTSPTTSCGSPACSTARTWTTRSAIERRRLQELEAEMTQERRLVGLARQLESATTYIGFRRVATLWTAGGGVGLILVIVGAVVQSTALLHRRRGRPHRHGGHGWRRLDHGRGSRDPPRAALERRSVAVAAVESAQD